MRHVYCGNHYSMIENTWNGNVISTSPSFANSIFNFNAWRRLWRSMIWFGLVNPILLVINYLENKKDGSTLALVVIIYNIMYVCILGCTHMYIWMLMYMCVWHLLFFQYFWLFETYLNLVYVLYWYICIYILCTHMYVCILIYVYACLAFVRFGYFWCFEC